MADLTLNIGPLNASVSASNNTKAANLISGYAEVIGAQGTNQEKAEAVLMALIVHMRDTTRQHRRKAKMQEATQEIEQELADLDWET